MPRSTTSRSREKKVNPHKLLGQISKAESDFQTQRYKLARRDKSTGTVSYDMKKLEVLIADFANKRAELIRSWEKHHTPLSFSRKQNCCCCCCCDGESAGESWIKDLDYSKYILFDSLGVTDNTHANDEKTASGAFHKSQSTPVFMQMATPNGSSGALSGEGRDSELSVGFERSGQGSGIVVDEAIIIEARRFGTLDMANAMACLWSRYEPLHVSIRRGT